MKKKALAVVLAASMLMMTACYTAKETTVSNGSGTEATADATTEPITTDSTADTTASDNQPGEEVIIPLFPEENREKICQMDPLELQKFSNYYNLFNIQESDKMDGSLPFLTNDCFNRNYEISTPPSSSSSTAHSIMIYIRQSMNNQITNDPNGPLTFVYYVEGVEVFASSRFIPLYYNETKQCFVGYWFMLNQSTGEAESYSLVEWFYNGNSTPMVDVVDVSDPSLYGF